MAIAVQWQTVAAFTGSTSLYTVPSGTSSSYGTYARDLVICNSGTIAAYIGFNTAASAAATASSCVIPPGGSLILTQCQVPAGSKVWGIASAAAQVSIGYATNVYYV